MNSGVASKYIHDDNNFTNKIPECKRWHRNVYMDDNCDSHNMGDNNKG